MISSLLPQESLFAWAHLTPDLRLGGVPVGSSQDEEYWLEAAKLPEAETQELRTIQHPNKRAQSIAARRCLRLLLNDSFVEVFKGSHQEPCLARDCGFISLAHTQGWAAAIWSRHSRVGIDIEELNRPINTEVARMFMNANELELYSWNIDTEYYLKNWCAKEVIYKIFQPCQIPVISFKNDIGIVPTTDPDVSTYKLNRPTEPTACGFVQYRKHSDLLIAYAVH